MESATVATTLKYLMDKNEVSVPELHGKTGIPKTTLYSMLKKQTNQADLECIKKIADFFGEEVSIFCGLDEYKPPVKLSDEESLLLTIFRTLNATGKERLIQYAKELGDNPKMKGKS